VREKDPLGQGGQALKSKLRYKMKRKEKKSEEKDHIKTERGESDWGNAELKKKGGGFGGAL